MEKVSNTLAVIAEREKYADKQRSKAQNILLLSDVLQMNQTQAEAALKQINLNSGKFTQQLEYKDLAQFKQTMHRLQSEFTRNQVSGGIHPIYVINRSRRADIKRFQNEINFATPIRKHKNGVVEFRVNASAQSKDTHHLVTIQFLNFHAAVAAGSVSNQLAKAVLQGPIKFDCDCGRHRFWYRYLATIGGFAYGKAETGFPKIRNPSLTGMACKHTLFVMRMLTRSPHMVQFMRGYISAYRKNPNQPIKTQSKQQAQKFERAVEAEAWRNTHIRQTAKTKMPKNLRDIFDPNKKISVRGMALSPEQLAAAQAKQLSPEEQKAIINQKINDPNLSLSAEKLSAIMKLLEH